MERETGEIVGSTDLSCVGRNLTEIGLSLSAVSADREGFHANVKGEESYCVFVEYQGNYIGRVLARRDLYKRIPTITIGLAFCLITIAIILFQVVTRYMNQYVVGGIHSVNEKLHSIAQGNLDELIDIRTSVEFSELSGYINRMKQSLLDNTQKMSYVLSKTNMYIGIYEYNRHMKRVRITQHVPRILCLKPGETDKLASTTGSFVRSSPTCAKIPLTAKPIYSP